MVCATSKASDQPARMRRSDQSICKSFEYSLNIKLLTEHHLEFLSLKGGFTGSSEFTMSKCHIVENHMSRLNWFRSMEKKLSLEL